MRWFSFDLSDLREMRFTNDEVEKFSARKGDVLICEGGFPGRCAIWTADEPVFFQKAIHRVRFHQPDRNKWFVYYLHFLEISGELRRFFTGTGIQHFTGQALARLQVPLPPLPEQRRIVGILDEAFAGIARAVAATEKNLANARELFESNLNEVFDHSHDGWIEKPLSGFVNEISTGPFGSLLHKSDYVQGGIPLVNPINIVGEQIVPDARKAVGERTYQRLSNYTLSLGDIVIGRRGEIGRCAVVGREQAGWLCGTGCFIIKPSEESNSHFLAHLLRSRHYRRILEQDAKRATMPNLSNKELARLVIQLPAIAEQRRLLGELDELRFETQRLESLYRRKLAALAELREALLQKAFAGELTREAGGCRP